MYEMKESGIEWIGQIPKHWEVRKVKYIVQSINGYAFNSVLYSDSGNCSIVRIGDICDSQIKYENVVKINANAQYLSKFKICKNDILFAMSGATVGKIGYVSEDVYNYFINQRVAIIRYKYNKFVYFFLSTNCFSEYVKLFAIGSAQPNISLEYFNDFYITFPPLDEQKKIADFLDNKVTEIDNLIDDTKKLIDKYKEYKQSLITETVTKGLHSNVEMKDSGIEWIGEIPKHWKVSRLKYLCDVRKRKNTQNIIMRYIGLENIESYTGKYKTTNSEYSLIDAIICQTNDIIFGKLRPYLSKTYIVDEISCCSSEFIVLYNVDNVKFIFFLLLSNGFIDSMSQIAYGAKMPRVSDEDILNFYLPLPPLDEQEEIVKYLDDKCSQIDSIIEEKQSLIEKLEEYKKSLIYEYVTGKKQV